MRKIPAEARRKTGMVYFFWKRSDIVSSGEERGASSSLSAALAASSVDASAAVSAHFTFCLRPVLDAPEDGAELLAFSLARRSLKLWYWLFTSSMKRGVEPPSADSSVDF
jgi:hypothetical protein